MIWRMILTSKPAPLASEIDFLDVLGQRPLLLLEPLDALDEGFEAVAGNAADIRHWSPPVLSWGTARP